MGVCASSQDDDNKHGDQKPVNQEPAKSVELASTPASAGAPENSDAARVLLLESVCIGKRTIFVGGAAGAFDPQKHSNVIQKEMRKLFGKWWQEPKLPEYDIIISSIRSYTNLRRLYVWKLSLTLKVQQDDTKFTHRRMKETFGEMKIDSQCCIEGKMVAMRCT